MPTADRATSGERHTALLVLVRTHELIAHATISRIRRNAWDRTGVVRSGGTARSVRCEDSGRQAAYRGLHLRPL